MSTVFSGVVSRWFPDRGFGFIAPSDGREEVFAHISECDPDIDELKSGEHVVFQVAPSSRYVGRVQAININVSK